MRHRAARGAFGGQPAHQKSLLRIVGLDGGKSAARNPNLPVDGWLMSEGSGSSFAASYGSGNTMTASNVTWSATAGFPGNAAHFNGTTSVAVGSNFTQTNFDGTTPFSVTAWFNATTLAPADQWLVITFDEGTAAFSGWGMEIVSSGALRVYLISNITGNYIDVLGASTVFAAGATHLATFTYDGSKTAAGVLMYVDGVVRGKITNSNTLTGSIVSGIPARLGAAKNGAGIGAPFSGTLGDVRIYNRVLSPTEISTLFAGGAQ